MTTDMHAETKRLLAKIRHLLAYQEEIESHYATVSTHKSTRELKERKRTIRRP